MIKKVILTFLLLIVLSKAQDGCGNLTERRVWTSSSHPNCSCGAPLGKSVQCFQGYILIQPCYCLFYDINKHVTVGGSCYFSCFYHNSDSHSYYFAIKQYKLRDYDLFNDHMCSAKLNRMGRFCGQCKPGYGYPVYSYDMKCTNCEGTSFKKWCKYLAIAFGPLTVFYIIMVTFRVSMPTSRLNGFLLVIQCFSSPFLLRLFHLWIQTGATINHAASIVTKIVFSVLGWANLDFFRELYSPFCLDPKYSVLKVISLDLCVALYPFFLIICTSYLIYCYDKNCWCVVSMWNLIKKLLRPILKKSVHVSLTETFATFILLSSIKIMGVSCDLLSYTKVYQENGLQEGPYVFYDTSIAYFGKMHAAYAFSAITATFFLVFLPFLLLLLYPSRMFHRVLNYCNIRSQTLHVFMDAFTGSYKVEPWDTRYFAAWYIFLRFLFYFSAFFFSSVLFFPAASITMIVGALSVAIVRPYKQACHNAQDIVVFLCASLVFISAFADVVASTMDFNHLHTAQTAVLFSLVALIVAVLASLLGNSVFKLATKFYFRCKLRLSHETFMPRGRINGTYETLAEVVQPQ